MIDTTASNNILLVEDDLSLSRGLSYTLEREGFTVDRAQTAAEAGKLAGEKPYRLILLDISLPDGNGFDIFSTLKAAAGAPIIFLTACDEEVNVVMGLDMGADDYISKPFRINELISRIRAVIRRAEAAGKNGGRADLLSSGTFMLNRGNSRFYNKGVEIRLTSTEFRLLAALFENRGNIVTREQLTEQLWDREEHYVDPNTLTVYIRRIREKLEKDPAEPVLIETIRGTGYRWN